MVIRGYGWLQVVMIDDGVGAGWWSWVVTVGYGIIIGSYGVVRGGWFWAVYECFCAVYEW